MAGNVTTVKVGSFELNTSLRRDVSGRAGTGPNDLKYSIPNDFVLLADLLKAITEAIKKPESFIRVNVDSTNTIVSVEGLEEAETGVDEPEEADISLTVALEVAPPIGSSRAKNARAKMAVPKKASTKKAGASQTDSKDESLSKASKK